MKIDQVLIQQLYNTKEITLQGIGTFRLDPSVPLPADTEKESVIPPNAITFQYNPRATEDAALIDAIVQYTKKIKPLASADLDSFLMLGRQFLNIGKPFIIDGLGTLDKAQNGDLEFVPGQFITPKIMAPKALKENEMEQSSGLFNDYADKPRSTDNGKKVLVIIIVVLVLGIIAWASYHYLFSKKKVAGEEVVKDTSEKQTPVSKDTLLQKKDTNAGVVTLPDTNKVTTQTTVDSSLNNDYTFRVVFKITFNKEAAESAVKKLKSWGHNVVMYTDSNGNYRLAEVFNRPLSDSAKVRDSLNKFYKAKAIFVEVK